MLNVMSPNHLTSRRDAHMTCAMKGLPVDRDVARL
jgi:hypothetical protein